MNIMFSCLKDKIKIKRDSVIKQQKVCLNHIMGYFQSITYGFSYMPYIFVPGGFWAKSCSCSGDLDQKKKLLK